MEKEQIRIGIEKARIFRETEMAYGIRLDGLNGTPDHGKNISQFTVYLPKSQVQDWREEGEMVFCYVPAWLVEKNGLDFLVDTSNTPTLF